MSSDLWIGALLSVPIGVGTGLLVTPLQRWMETRGKNRALATTQRVERDYRDILFYRLHPHIFTQYLLQVALRTTFYGAALGIIAGFIYAAAQATTLGHSVMPHSILDLARELLYVIGQMTAIVGSILIIRVCLPALAAWHRVRNFEEYAKNIPSDIRDPGRETLALANESASAV